MELGYSTDQRRILLRGITAMGYRNLRECVEDLERHGQLLRCDEPVDPFLEVAEIQRRVYQRQGPAVLFTAAKRCRFALLGNLFGTVERAKFLFRDTWESVRRLIELKADPTSILRQPLRYWTAARAAWRMLPRRVRHAPVLVHRIGLEDLPHIQNWPGDAGAFITLPLVYTEDPRRPGPQRANLGMYRIQLSGGQYQPERQVGLHYQIHRGIAVHHQAALARRERLTVEIWVGGAPAMMLAAVMPLPEGLSELAFAGALAGHRIRLVQRTGQPAIYADADFRIRGSVLDDTLLPEGPFGDHLGYYSLAHPFPVLEVHEVSHRPGAIWPFTVVGRPPQEDTTFGQLIHELSGPMIPALLPGVREVHAVDAAGVHPLLLAIGSERYTPYCAIEEPQEILTQANAILGHGQMSLAKYLIIVDGTHHADLSTHDIPRFFEHVLQRADWQRDLHFQTCTTIDTLDYSGGKLNRGSKVVIAAAGPPRYNLSSHWPGELALPAGFRAPTPFSPGILLIEGPRHSVFGAESDPDLRRLCEWFAAHKELSGFRWVVVVDDVAFASRSWENFLWVTFTRSNPASDITGAHATWRDKHWGCSGPLVIDARIKAHHPPALEPDPEVVRRIDALAARGGPLSRYL